nr:FMN-binding protein [Klebsiella pneumoniae]
MIDIHSAFSQHLLQLTVTDAAYHCYSTRSYGEKSAAAGNFGSNWRKQWPGKRLLDNSGHPALKIVQDKPEHADEYTVDGISGATLTSTGVEKSINYWMGPQGYGQFLQRLASDRNNLNL